MLLVGLLVIDTNGITYCNNGKQLLDISVQIVLLKSITVISLLMAVIVVK